MKSDATAAELRRASGVFKALGHPDRLRLTCVVAERERTSQKELVEALGWPQSTLSRHLGVLRDHGLVTSTRRGAEVWLEPTMLPHVLLDTVCAWMEIEGGGAREPAGVDA